MKKKIAKAISKINFIIDPSEHMDKYVCVNGTTIRIQFLPAGIMLTDSNGEIVQDTLLRLRSLKMLSL
ncbi:hypothetical protein [Vibrio sp. ER1A]|uniref:hypothetical protein n=1 Tax=Vibrio sp. ER1A TaxID=1517681 RepID=UPI000A69E752|nr:hypothetical protein [Vibrio sp. ER1A]